jgi:hypothetical protein
MIIMVITHPSSCWHIITAFIVIDFLPSQLRFYCYIYCSFAYPHSPEDHVVLCLFVLRYNIRLEYLVYFHLVRCNNKRPALMAHLPLNQD